MGIRLIQVIDFKTRKENILDLVLCKTVSTLPFAKAVALLVKSDHECIKFVIDIYHNVQQNSSEVTSMYNFKKANWVKLLNKLSNIKWFLLFSQLSVNEMLLCFKQNLRKVIVENVPLITIRQQQHKRYVPKHIKHLI